MTTTAGRWSTWCPRLELIAVGILASVFIWKGFLVGWASLSTDFPNYYLGGRLFRAGWPLERLNDWIWMQRQKDHAGLDQGLVGYLPSTFWSSLMIVPLTWLPPLAAKRVWLVLNLVLLGGVVLLLRRLTQLSYRRIALVVLLAIVPLRTNFQFGQQHVVVLFLLSVAAWAYFDERPVLSGIALALAASLKLYPALFLLFFARKRRWRPLIALVGALLVLGVLDVVLFGFDGLQDYLLRILPRSVRGEYNDPYIPNLNKQPAISADGRWLGFIREQRGRGALWLLDRSAAGPGGPRPAERRLLDAAQDVLDFSFLPDGHVVLSSVRDGRPSLSVLDPRSGELVRLETSDRPARYPAPSPDGRWLAYAELERGQWQIWRMDMQTRERRQLTAADCNSVTPSWTTDSKTLVFASDCARGIGHTALFNIRADDHLPVESTVHTHDH